MNERRKSVAVIGTGPAGLMAADVISRAGHFVTLYEKRSGAGRKLLIAGSSGLNISHDGNPDEFCRNYRGPSEHFQALFKLFPREAWIAFVESLGVKTFLGTSHRYFVEGMKAAPLLKAWLARLQDQGAEFKYNRELIGVERQSSGVQLRFHDDAGSEESPVFDAACLALGGGSYEDSLRWPEIFKSRGIRFESFQPSNVGFEVGWSESFLKEAEGLPLKRIVLTTPRGRKAGDLMITRYGLEGTPIYHLGAPGEAFLDLKPDLTVEQIEKKLSAVKENMAPLRKVRKQLSLCPAALALLYHESPRSESTREIVQRMKNFPITLRAPRPLEEAISSAGGISFDELTPELMLKKIPGVFAAGEMLDWDAPTGGFLIQGCASQGFLAGTGLVNYLRGHRDSGSP